MSDIAGAWSGQCLGRSDIAPVSLREIGQGRSSRVWECSLELAGTHRLDVVLKVYDWKCREYTRLSPAQTAHKHALALEQFGKRDIPVPRLLGWASGQADAAILTERVRALPCSSDTRVEAARALTRLHGIAISDLSAELAGLIDMSLPNRARILNGVRDMAHHLDAAVSGWRTEHPRVSEIVDAVTFRGESAAQEQTLVHGDYFSANILATPCGVCIVDWDLLSLGDPMWDLGFLVTADRGVTEDEAETVVKAYQEVRPVDALRLRWNRDCWEAF